MPRYAIRHASVKTGSFSYVEGLDHEDALRQFLTDKIRASEVSSSASQSLYNLICSINADWAVFELDDGIVIKAKVGMLEGLSMETQRGKKPA